MKTGRILLLLAVAAVIALVLFTPLGDGITLEALKAEQAGLEARVTEQALLAAAIFFLLYVASSALSLPFAAILTLAGGALFGLVWGTIIVSFASTIGASLAFLGSRYLLRDWVKAKFGRQIEAIDRGIARDGPWYLLTLRLNPVFPYFLVNLAMGLTRIRLGTYYLFSQIGMLPATIVYVNAGTQLARIDRVEDIVSPQLIGSLVLISLLPLIGKAAAGWLRRRRAWRGWKKPKRFDRNLIVIGAGAGGLVTSYIAAAAKAKVTLIEAKQMGGDCLNTGCVPSKTLIRSALAAHEVATAGRRGIAVEGARVRFGDVIERVHAAIAEIAPNDSPERYRAMGVDVRQGHARLVDPWTVEIDGGERLTSRAIVIAAGAEPFVPDIPGLETSGYLTSDTMWDALRGREEAPPRIAIVGGGPIGCELAQAFARLGSAVTLVEHGERLLSKEDEEAAALIAETLAAERVDVRTGSEAACVEGKTFLLRSGGGEARVAFDELIVAVGRRARLSGYGLEALGIDTDGTVVVNDWLETRFPNIYAVGDAAGPYQLTHAAAHQAWYAAVNALFGSVRRFRADYRVLPRVTFTDPEVAQVGHTEASARAERIDFETVRYDLAELDRAVTDDARRGFVKILVPPGKDRILGATAVGAHAGETIAELTLAMRHGLGLGKILGTVHAYPTFAEANKFAAGAWRKAHAPERLLRWAQRWHRWHRG